jgi:hypothetical protein
MVLFLHLLALPIGWPQSLADYQPFTECIVPGAGCTRLSIGYKDLTGTIPTEIGQLTDVSYLVIRDNKLTGTLPTEIALMTKLTYFNAFGNDLTGTVPSELGAMTQLLSFNLAFTYVDKKVPDGLQPGVISFAKAESDSAQLKQHRQSGSLAVFGLGVIFAVGVAALALAPIARSRSDNKTALEAATVLELA